MESAFNIKNIAIYILFAIFFVFDRVLKYLALNSTGESNILGEYIKFNYSANFNIAFSYCNSLKYWQAPLRVV